MEKVVVIGAGGHAKVCIELLRESNYQVAYCVGENDSPKSCLNVPVLIGDEQLSKLYEKGYRKVFIAIGSNTLRERLASLVLELGFELVNAISPKAIISPSARHGDGVAIMAGAIINADSKVDDLAIINTAATIDHDCKVGKSVHIAPQCALAGCVSVGDRSFLGIGTKVIPEIDIGRDVIVGAGAVVIKNILSGLTVVGVPARTAN